MNRNSDGSIRTMATRGHVNPFQITKTHREIMFNNNISTYQRNQNESMRTSREHLASNMHKLATNEAGQVDATPSNIVEYKKILRSAPLIKATELFDNDFIREYKISPKENIGIIEGHLLQPRLFGFKSPIPASTEYLYYIVHNIERKKPFHKILECKMREGA